MPNPETPSPNEPSEDSESDEILEPDEIIEPEVSEETNDKRIRSAGDIGDTAVEATVEEDIQDTARREYEEEMARRKKEPADSKDTTGTSPEEPSPEDKAKLHDIPENIVREAAEQGIPIDYLIHAKSSGAAGERLRKLGINWGAKVEPEPDAGPGDPRIKILRQGKAHREAVQAIQRQIEQDPGELRGTLKRSGSINFWLLKPMAPLWRPLWIRAKARQIDLDSRQERDSNQLYDDGLLGRGSDRRRRIRKFLKRHDQEIALSRSKLNLLNRHGLNALESERKHLAERILRLCRQQAAIDHSRIDPFDFYDHNQFKKDFEDYQQDVPQRGIERDKYAEF